MKSWDKYEEACKTIFRDPSDEWGEIYDDHSLEIYLYSKFEKELIKLGYKKKVRDDNYLNRGEYEKDDFLFDENTFKIEFDCPSCWMDWFEEEEHLKVTHSDIELEKGLNLPKAKQIIEILGLNEEWIKFIRYGC
tara:strand:+ start:43 stop:447 length:405 start_codon:yes stop_codon:yes gene_type:complete